MKIHPTLLLVSVLFCFGRIFAADSHVGRNHGMEKAPHHGRLMEIEKMHVEFVLQSDRTAHLYLFDESMKAIQPTDAQATLVLQGKEGAFKTKTILVKKDDILVSEAPLIIQEGAKAVLILKIGDKTQNLRFDLNLSPCGACDAPEYACACAH